MYIVHGNNENTLIYQLTVQVLFQVGERRSARASCGPRSAHCPITIMPKLESMTYSPVIPHFCPAFQLRNKNIYPMSIYVKLET